MSLLLLFADQEQQTVQPARRRRQTVIVRLRGKRPRIVPFVEEWERERKGAPTAIHDTQQLSPDDLARALAEDEELLLLLD